MSNDVTEKKAVTGFLADMSENTGRLKAMAYAISRGAGTLKKGGAPKNTGRSNDVSENKGQKKWLSRMSKDVDENK